MKILEPGTPSSLKLQDTQVISKLYEKTLYTISDAVLNTVKQQLKPGKTIVLCSGSYRLDIDATYVENIIFKNSDKPHHKNAMFVDLGRDEIVNLIFKKVKPSNILILHSALFCQYRNVEKITADMNHLKQYVDPGGQVILTVPHVRINYNRLTTSLDTLAANIPALLIDEDLIIVK